jgi:hypothetical protein
LAALSRRIDATRTNASSETGIYRSQSWSSANRDPRPQEASDGHIGDIDEVSFDIGSGCIIVDTGFWIFGKKGMVPAGMIEKIEPPSAPVPCSCRLP